MKIVCYISQKAVFEEIEMPDVIKNENPFDNIKENQMIIGYNTDESLKNKYTSSDSPFYTFYYPVGISGPGKYKMCISFDKKLLTPYVGNSIKSIRFGLSNTRELSNLKFWIGTGRDKEDLYTQSISDIQTGWNVVNLDTPFELTAQYDSIFIGIDYQQNSMNAPIPLRQFEQFIPIIGAGYMYGPYAGSDGMWVNIAELHQNSVPLMCIIEGDNIPKYNLQIMGASTNKYFRVGEQNHTDVFIKNWGKYYPEKFELTCSLDGKTIYNEELTRWLNDFYEPFSSSIIPVDTKAGKQDMIIEIPSINGKEIEEEARPQTKLKVKIFRNDIGRQKSLYESHHFVSCDNTPSTDRDSKQAIGDGTHYVLVNEHHGDGLDCEASYKVVHILETIRHCHLRLTFLSRTPTIKIEECCISQFREDVQKILSHWKEMQI